MDLSNTSIHSETQTLLSGAVIQVLLNDEADIVAVLKPAICRRTAFKLQLLEFTSVLCVLIQLRCGKVCVFNPQASEIYITSDGTVPPKSVIARHTMTEPCIDGALVPVPEPEFDWDLLPLPEPFDSLSHDAWSRVLKRKSVYERDWCCHCKFLGVVPSFNSSVMWYFRDLELVPSWNAWMSKE